MHALVTEHFAPYPAQSRVARLLLQHGLAVRDGAVWCGAIAITDTALARAANVDRRVVGATIETISGDPRLEAVFSKLAATALLTDAAPALGWGVVSIVPQDASMPGILASVASVMARHGISIRQAIVEDPELAEQPRLYIITESPLPADVVPEVQEAQGVKSVVLPHASERARHPSAR